MTHVTSAFDEHVRKLVAEWKVPGLAIAVVEGDTIDAKVHVLFHYLQRAILTCTQGYGQANLQGDICTADSLFDCASISKSFTAASIALLVEDDAYPDVKWRTPVSKLLPDDFVLPNSYLTANVTIEDILSHCSGFPTHDDALYGQRAAQPDDARSVTRNLRNLPFNKPLRTDYQYSNIMYTVATHLIEIVTGQSYGNFVRTRIWEPLGMTNTYHDFSSVEAEGARARLAMGYHWSEKDGKYTVIPSYAQPEAQGAGCVFSSVNDYAKWVRALLQQSGPLSKNAHKEMVKGRTTIPFEGNDVLPFYGHSLYALGLISESYRGHEVVGHNGSFEGFRALMRYLPGKDWGAVMFGNSDGAYYVLQILFHQLVDELLDVSREGRTDWPAYWRNYQADDDEDEEDTELALSVSPEPLSVALSELAGAYTNPGYRTLVVTCEGGRLEANCSDRCVPFGLAFEHLSGNSFVVRYENLLDKLVHKMKAEFDIGQDGVVEGVMIPFCEEMTDDPVRFEKVE
ncbi:hypothetical protein N0V94_006138 [Neodidymelliopsis sp. IMI 364377]|nr:hypothetical protein N0V94_006138 [Neodidymelliopsis sp. IMI 364377]